MRFFHIFLHSFVLATLTSRVLYILHTYVLQLIVTMHGKSYSDIIIIVSFWQETLWHKKYLISWKNKAQLSMAIGNGNSCMRVFPNTRYYSW